MTSTRTGEDTVSFAASALAWRAEAADAEILRREVASRLDLLERVPGAAVLKRNLVRTVLRVPLSDGRRVIVKRYRVAGLEQLLKYLVAPSRARTEWQVGRALERAGLPAPVPLAFAERRRGPLLRDAALITREVADSLHLNAYIDTHLRGTPERDAQRAALYGELARLTRRMHDAGFAHNDFHGGNLLVNGPPESPRLHVIDLHSVTRPARLSQRKRWQDLCKLLHSLRASATPAERVQICEVYASACAAPTRVARLSASGQLAARIERAIERDELRRVKSRTARCLARSTLFEISAVAGCRVHHLREVDAAAVVALAGRHERDVAAGAPGVLKSSARSALTRQRLGARDVIVKQFHDVWWERARNLVRPRALASWLAGNGLRVRGFDAAQPLALVLRGRGLLLRDAFLVMEDLGAERRADRVALARFAGPKERAPRAEKRALVAGAAELVRRLHAAGVYHADLKAVNLFVRGEPAGARFVLADYDRVTLDRAVSTRRRVKNLAQLSASVPVCVSRAYRLRFFRAYAAGDAAAQRDWKAWARRIIDECQGKIVVGIAPIE